MSSPNTWQYWSIIYNRGAIGFFQFLSQCNGLACLIILLGI